MWHFFLKTFLFFLEKSSQRKKKEQKNQQMMLNKATPWKLTCPQTLVCICLHASFLIASLTAVVFGTWPNAWLPSQHNYQTTLTVWGATNLAMQVLFFVNLLMLSFAQQCFVRNSTIENIKLVIMMHGFFWLAANLAIWVLGSIFFWKECGLGSIGIYQYSVLLFSYLAFLLFLLFVYIGIYVWPTCDPGCC